MSKDAMSRFAAVQAHSPWTFKELSHQKTSTATRSCRDPETAVIIDFWLPGSVRRRPQRVTSAADATRYGRRRFYYGRAAPLLRLLLMLLYSQFDD